MPNTKLICDAYYECLDCETVMHGSLVMSEGNNMKEICPVCGAINSFKAVQMLVENNLDTFYFTFGSSELYPFQGGWLEITAPNKREAIRVFRKHFPNREGSNCYNAADCYDSDTFKNHTDMLETGNLGAFCHARIEYEED